MLALGLLLLPDWFARLTGFGTFLLHLWSGTSRAARIL